MSPLRVIDKQTALEIQEWTTPLVGVNSSNIIALGPHYGFINLLLLEILRIATGKIRELYAMRMPTSRLLFLQILSGS